MRILVVITLFIGTLTCSAFAQKNKDNGNTSISNGSVELAKKKYKMAIGYNDGEAAKNAIFEILALDPSQTNYKDSLAIIYFQLQQNASAIAVTNEILETDNNNNFMREIRAVSEKNAGQVLPALKDYETLFQATNNMLYLYEIALIQYQLKRFGECKLSTDALLSKANDSLVVSVFYGNGQGQRVPLKAAVQNLRGTMFMEINEEAAAKASYEEAVRLYPDFALAKNNLAVLQKKQEADKKK